MRLQSSDSFWLGMSKIAKIFKYNLLEADNISKQSLKLIASFFEDKDILSAIQSHIHRIERAEDILNRNSHRLLSFIYTFSDIAHENHHELLSTDIKTNITYQTKNYSITSFCNAIKKTISENDFLASEYSFDLDESEHLRFIQDYLMNHSNTTSINTLKKWCHYDEQYNLKGYKAFLEHKTLHDKINNNTQHKKSVRI